MLNKTWIMRISGCAAVIAMVFLTFCEVHAEDKYSGWVDYYQSNNGVRDTSPSVIISKDLNDQSSLLLKYDADVVTAASWDHKNSKTHQFYSRDCSSCHGTVNGITGASKDFWEHRQAITAGLSHRLQETDLKASYNYSTENDYRSNAVSLGMSQDLFSRNTTVALAFTNAADAIFPRYMGYVKDKDTVTYDLSLSQVWSPVTTSRFALSYGDQYGLLSDPYRWIIVGGNTGEPIAESDPDYLAHVTFSMFLNHYIMSEGSFLLDYRYYQDNWQVQSHTFGINYNQALFSGLEVSPEWRYYTQTGAYFFKNFYNQPEAYMTRDLKLAPFYSTQWGLSLIYPYQESWNLELRYLQYDQTSALDYSWYFYNGDTHAQSVQLGLTMH